MHRKQVLVKLSEILYDPLKHNNKSLFFIHSKLSNYESQF